MALVPEQAEVAFQSNAGDPLRALSDWQALHPALHWRAGRSAVRLAETWSEAEGFPAEVQAALNNAARLGGLRFLRAVAEHETPMPGQGKASVTDLMVWAEDELGNPVILGVEAKVDEGFGPRVHDWLQAGQGKGSAENRARRLRRICVGLELNDQDQAVGGLPYQLLHRTYAAVLTAVEERARRAVLVVHSFAGGIDTPRSGWGELVDFARALGVDGELVPGIPRPAGVRDGVELWLVWVSAR